MATGADIHRMLGLPVDQERYDAELLQPVALHQLLHLGKWSEITALIDAGKLEPRRCVEVMRGKPPGADGYPLTPSTLVVGCLGDFIIAAITDAERAKRWRRMETLACVADDVGAEWAALEDPVTPTTTRQETRILKAWSMISTWLGQLSSQDRERSGAAWSPCLLGSFHIHTNRSPFAVMASQILLPDTHQDETTIQPKLVAAVWQAAVTITKTGFVSYGNKDFQSPAMVVDWAGMALQERQRRGHSLTIMRRELTTRWRRRRKLGIGEWLVISTWFRLDVIGKDEVRVCGQSLIDLAASHMTDGGAEILATLA